MKLKFWKRVPPETQTELEALRSKVAEYAGKIVLLEKRHETTMRTWSRHTRILLGLECPTCGADIVAWREQLHEEHHCPQKQPDMSFYTCYKEEMLGKEKKVNE